MTRRCSAGSSSAGADFDSRAAEVVTDLGLDPRTLSIETSGLSGGQMARASLAAVLLSRFDVLLLDEPTNDLDLDGLARLEAFVLGRRGGLAVVSHDREFLARTITDVLELDPHNRLTRQFAGGWEAFLDERETARRHLREQFDDYSDKRGELRDRMQAAREQSVRGALRAKRKAPDNDRTARGARIEAATSGAAKVRSLETRLERLDADAVVEPRKEWELRIELPSAARSGEMVAAMHGGRRQARRLHPRAGRPRHQVGRPGRGRRDPTAAARPPCCRRCSGDCRSRRARRRWGPA